MSESVIQRTALPRLSLKARVLAAILGAAAAVALPQLFHLLGAVSGLGTVPGEVFLPMHLPIILLGLIAGPFAGAAAGLASPILSFAFTGMPTASMLPFMALELCAYGFFAGVLRNVKINTIFKVLITELAGRILRAGAIMISFYVFGNTAVSLPVIWNSILTGLPGLILQWTLIPLIIFWVNERSKNEQ